MYILTHRDESFVCVFESTFFWYIFLIQFFFDAAGFDTIFYAICFDAISSDTIGFEAICFDAIWFWYN